MGVSGYGGGEVLRLCALHPAVEDVQIVGVPDLKYGEEILAWIKLREGQTATAEEVRAYCRSGLAHYKTPRYVEFVSSFPTTVTGKIQKFRIREIAIEPLRPGPPRSFAAPWRSLSRSAHPLGWPPRRQPRQFQSCFMAAATSSRCALLPASTDRAATPGKQSEREADCR